MTISDQPFDVGGRIFRAFSIEHLRWQNQLADLAPAELLQRLVDVAVAPDAIFTGLLVAAARQLALHLGIQIREGLPPAPENAGDKRLIELLVQMGHMQGLGSPPYIGASADLLWAVAAALLEANGAQHSNDLPEDRIRS